MSDRSKEQLLAAAIIDKRLRRALGKLLIKGHRIGGARSVLTIAPGTPEQPEYTVSLLDDRVKLFIEGQDVSNSSRTFARARQAITDIEKRVDEAPCLIPGFPAGATPGAPALERLAGAIDASIALGLPFIIKAPGHLFPEHEDDVFSGTDAWSTTISSNKPLGDPGERFTVDVLFDKPPVSSFMDTYTDPNLNIMTVEDLRRTPALNRMLSSVAVNEKFVAMFKGTEGLKAASALRFVFSVTGQEQFSSFISSTLDDLFSPGKWKDDFGDISRLTVEQQERLLSPSIFFSSTRLPAGTVEADINLAVDLGHSGDSTASLWIDQSQWLLSGSDKKKGMFKSKMKDWSKPAGAVRDIFEEQMPVFRRSGQKTWSLFFKLPDGTDVEESSLFSLYSTILLAELLYLPSGVVSSNDVAQAQRMAMDATKGLVERLFEIRTGLFMDTELAKDMLAGKRIGHDTDMPEGEEEKTDATPMTDEAWTKNMEQLAKDMGAILEKFYSEALGLHRKHAGKYGNLGVIKDTNSPASWSNYVTLEYAIKVQGTHKGGVVASYGYHTLQNAASNSFHNWRTFITFKPDLRAINTEQGHHHPGVSLRPPELIVNMTGATAKTISSNIKKALSSQKDSRTGKTAELDALLDRIARDHDKVADSLAKEADAHISMLGKAVTDEEQRFYDVMGGDFPEEYLEVICTMDMKP